MDNRFISIKYIFESIFEPKLYSGLIKDILISLVVFIFSTIIFLFLIDFPSGLLSFLFSSLKIILIPFIITLIFYLVKSENRFSKLASYGLEIDYSSLNTKFSFFLYLRIIFLILIFSILSFLPFIGFFFSAYLLAFDSFTYVTEVLGLNYKEQKKFLSENFISSYIIGLVILCISLIPFGFFFAYPLGILSMAKLYRVIKSAK